MPSLERTEIADDFSRCASHGELAKIGDCCNNNERMESDQMSSVLCKNCDNKDDGLSMLGTFART